MRYELEPDERIIQSEDKIGYQTEDGFHKHSGLVYADKGELIFTNKRLIYTGKKYNLSMNNIQSISQMKSPRGVFFINIRYIDNINQAQNAYLIKAAFVSGLKESQFLLDSLMGWSNNFHVIKSPPNYSLPHQQYQQHTPPQQYPPQEQYGQQQYQQAPQQGQYPTPPPQPKYYDPNLQAMTSQILSSLITIQVPSYIDTDSTTEILFIFQNNTQIEIMDLAVDLSDLEQFFSVKGSIEMPALRPGMELEMPIQIKPKYPKGSFPIKIKIKGNGVTIEKQYGIKVGGTEIY